MRAGYYAKPPEAAGRAPALVPALRRGPRGFLAEVKPASPAGTLRADADARTLAAAFAREGARGVSVLTEPETFRGSLANLSAAAACGAPVLMKDFVVSEEQLDAAQACGASAVLLILPLHERGHAPPVEAAIAAARARGLEVVLEVYDAPDLARAARTEADVLAVNTRDLRDLSIDPARFARVARGFAKDRPLVALSGVEDAAGARAMFDGGADAVLVGSALMRSPDPALRLREMMAACA